MKLQSTSEFKATIASAYINEDILNILRRMYVRRVKNKVLRLFIFCYLYERAQ
jgi:hypothetical protein